MNFIKEGNNIKDKYRHIFTDAFIIKQEFLETKIRDNKL